MLVTTMFHGAKHWSSMHVAEYFDKTENNVTGVRTIEYFSYCCLKEIISQHNRTNTGLTLAENFIILYLSAISSLNSYNQNCENSS